MIEFVINDRLSHWTMNIENITYGIKTNHQIYFIRAIFNFIAHCITNSDHGRLIQQNCVHQISYTVLSWRERVTPREFLHAAPDYHFVYFILLFFSPYICVQLKLLIQMVIDSMLCHRPATPIKLHLIVSVHKKI